MVDGSGVKTHRTWVIAADVQSLERRWDMLGHEKDQRKKEVFFIQIEIAT